MADHLNLYGDQLVATTGQHGADIACQRLDDLDRLSLRFALDQLDEPGLCVDLGAGSGAHGLRFAALGSTTLIIDRLPLQQTLLGNPELARIFPASYLQKDACALSPQDFAQPIKLCHSQRFIHYLPQAAALQLLGVLRQCMQPQARLFLSASGLDSELGDGYAGRSQPLQQRFAPLAAAMAERHNIHAPVCLYTEDELAALCSAAGFQPERVWRSAFGNIKGVFSLR